MKKLKNVFMFSGQGSQYFQMGKALYEHSETFRRWMRCMDHVVRQLTSHSVVEALYEQDGKKGDIFDRTLLTHPAIYMVEYALAQTLIEMGFEPDLILGVSMGSFAAATVAGCIAVEDGLKAVVRQADMLEAYCQKGGMTAIFSNARLLNEEVFRLHCEMAWQNYPYHFTVSARREDLTNVEALLRARGVYFQRLPVSFAFHSQWIDEARIPFERSLRLLPHKLARIPMVCSARVETICMLPENYLWNVIRDLMRFRETIEHLEGQAAYVYIDCGPSGTLATTLKHLLPLASESIAHTILSPFSRELRNIEALRRLAL
jgi:acyl transferase domain-containing protein